MWHVAILQIVSRQILAQAVKNGEDYIFLMFEIKGSFKKYWLLAR